jgi:hypothetical protein
MSESTALTRNLVKRFRQESSDRTTVQQIWDLINRYIQPHRGRFFQEQKQEQSINWTDSRENFDSTALQGAVNLASRLHGDITSPSLRWFDIRFRDTKLNANKQVTEWTQRVSDRIFYELQDSSFDLEINKVYQDLVGPGTAVLTLEEKPGVKNKWNGLQFISVPLKEAYFEEDLEGGATRFYRHLEWTPAQCILQFGKDTPEDIVKLDEDGNSDKIDILFAIYPRNNKILGLGEKVAPSARPLGFCYIRLNSAEMLGKEGGYYEMPAMVGRWATTNSSQWGHSPSMTAIWDVLTLNECIQQNLRKAAKSNDWPLLVEERANINQLNMGQGTVSVVRSIAGVAAMPSGGSDSDMDTEIARLVENIKSYYMTDTLDFPQAQGTPMSATEAGIRYERLQRFMAPTLGHIRADVLNPSIERSFNMLMRAGELPDLPEILKTAENNDLDIIYLGSLARAQQTDAVGAIERTMAAAANAGLAWPGALDVIDPIEAVRQIGMKLNAPAVMMRDKNEVTRLQEDREAQQAQANAAAIAEQEGNAAKAQGEGQMAMEGAT